MLQFSLRAAEYQIQHGSDKGHQQHDQYPYDLDIRRIEFRTNDIYKCQNGYQQCAYYQYYKEKGSGHSDKQVHKPVFII